MRIGVGLSVAAFVGLVAALPVGHRADRIGGRPAWVAVGLVGAGCFASYPLSTGFTEVPPVMSWVERTERPGVHPP